MRISLALRSMMSICTILVLTLVVVDASDRGGTRGNALPLLLDLDRKSLFLHDASVTSLDELLNPERGRLSPHPFYFADAGQRSDMVAFLRSLDTGDAPASTKGSAR